MRMNNLIVARAKIEPAEIPIEPSLPSPKRATCSRFFAHPSLLYRTTNYSYSLLGSFLIACLRVERKHYHQYQHHHQHMHIKMEEPPPQSSVLSRVRIFESVDGSQQEKNRQHLENALPRKPTYFSSRQASPQRTPSPNLSVQGRTSPRVDPAGQCPLKSTSEGEHLRIEETLRPTSGSLMQHGRAKADRRREQEVPSKS